MSRIKIAALIASVSATLGLIAAAPIGGNSGGYIGTIIPSSAAVTNFLCGTGVLNSAQVCTSSAVLPNGVTATTQTTGDNTTKVATDAFVLANAGSASIPSIPTTTPVTGTGSAGGVQAATGTLVLPTGTTATTATTGDNTTKVATTAFVIANAASASIPNVPTTTPLTGTGVAGSAQAATGTLVLPNGTTATTQTTGDNSTKVATTAFVLANGSGLGCASGTNLSTCTSAATATPSFRSFATRASDIFNPKNYGAVGSGSANTVYNILGVNSLSALAAYTANGLTPYSWVTNSIYGLTFSLATNTAQGSAGTTIAYTSPTTSASLTGPTAASFNYGATSNVVLPGMTVTGSCIATNTKVTAVTNGLAFSINTPYASASGQAKIRLPFVGGISIGMPVYTTSGTAIGTVTAINQTLYTPSGYNNNLPTMVGTDASPANGYYSVTSGSTTATLLSGSLPASPPSNAPQVVAPTTSTNSGGTGAQLLFPSETLINAVSGSTVTTSLPANITNSNYQQIFAVSPPTITISANLGTAISANSTIYFGGISTVTLNNATSSACGANTSLTYAFTTGNTGTEGSGDVGDLDMDYLGAQSAANAAVAASGELSFPAGKYILWPHVTLVNASTPIAGAGYVHVHGAGSGATTFWAPQETTRGNCLLSVYDRTSQNQMGVDYDSFKLLGYGGSNVTLGYENSLANGLCVYSNEHLSSIIAQGFKAGISSIGNHDWFTDISTGYNWYGFYNEDNPYTSGAEFFNRVDFIGDNFAEIGAAWNSGFDYSTFENMHFGFDPYGWYRGGQPYGLSASIGNWLSNSKLAFVASEGNNNGVMYGENGATNGGGDKIIFNTFENVSFGVSPNYGQVIPTASINAVISAGTFQYMTFINSNMNLPGGNNFPPSAVVLCAIICGGPSPSQVSGSLISNNNWTDDSSSLGITTTPGTSINSGTYNAPAYLFNYYVGNKWNTSNAAGQFYGGPGCGGAGTGGYITPLGQIMALGGANGSTVNAMTTGAFALGVAVNGVPGNAAWPNCGPVAVALSGVANAQYTNTGSAGGAAVVSSTTPSEVTTTAAGDATAVRIGAFEGSTSSGLSVIYVRPSP